MYDKIAVWATFALAALASVAAHDRRSPGSPSTGKLQRMLRRDFPTNEADMATTSNAKLACSGQDVPGMLDLKKNQPFPKSWEIANLIQNDTTANQVWQDIQNSGIIPSNVQVKQASDNTHMGVESDDYSASRDPDCWWTQSMCTKPKASNLPDDLSSCPEPSTWGLTFDDGPNCSHNVFYDYLKQQNLKATMFYIGSNVYDTPLQAQRGLVDGHDICVHTWSHRYMTTLSNEQAFAELYYTMLIIKATMGITVTCWRPPFGDVDDRIRAIAAGLGLSTVLWEQDTDDWEIDEKSASTIDSNYQSIYGKAGTESPIVLTHEIDNGTMSEFIKQFPSLKKAYPNVVSPRACQNITHPYQEDITYPTFSDVIGGNVMPKNLPDGKSMSIDANPKMNIVAVANQTTGYAKPMSQQQIEASQASASSSAAAATSTNSRDNSSNDVGKSSANALHAVPLLATLALTLAVTLVTVYY